MYKISLVPSGPLNIDVDSEELIVISAQSSESSILHNFCIRGVLKIICIK